jgi:hypothetical protein
MKTALYAALVLLAVSLTAAVLVVAYDVHRDLAALGSDLVETHAVLTQAAKAESDFAGIAVKLSATADTVNGAASEERKNWAATSQEAAATGRALRLLISRVDRSFVDGTLYHVNQQTLPAIDAQVAQNGDQMAATLAKLGGTADSLTRAAGSLNLRLGDPQIAELLGHANAISASLETVAANSAAMSGDMRLAVHRLAAPPSKWHQALDVGWTTAKFGSLFIP